jgi:tetratricopeptide (TPR) repeat protein
VNLTISHQAKTILAAVILAAVGTAAYLDSFSGVFLFDDTPGIIENNAIRQLWPPWPIFRGPRPVLDLTFAANYAIGGLRVFGYHLVNLAVHLLAALTLFGIVRRTLSVPPLVQRFGSAACALALAVALLWMVHPLQTESVTYIVQRAESLMGLFYLLTLYCAIRGFSSPDYRRSWHAAAVAACALGMGVKLVMVTAPLMVLVYDRLFVAPSLKAALRRSRPLYLGLAATWLIAAFLVARNPAEPSAGFGMESLTPWRYARTQFGVIAHYLALSFRPWPLCLDYGWPVAWDVRDILPPALLVLALAGATIACLRRARLAGPAFAGVWFFLILAPTSSVMPIHDLCFEHRMYLPLAGVIALTVMGAYALGRRALELAVPAEHREFRQRLGTSIAAVSCLAVIGFLGSLTLLRNQLYGNEATIWKDATNHQPRNARAFINLGCALINQGRCEEALGYLLHALEIKQGYPPTRNNRGLTLTEAGRAAAHNNLGIALSELGRYDEAMRQFDEGLALKPDDPSAQYHCANTLVALGRAPEAIAHYREAIRLRPEFSDAHYNLAAALAELGRTEEAISEYEETLRLAPANGRAHNNLGRLLALQVRPAEALAHYREALRLLPDSPVVRANLAWLRATCADPKFRDASEALRLAREQAAAGSPAEGAPNARALDVLAAACAEAGQFDQAVAAARQAIAAAERSGGKPSASEIRARLKLYESRRPYRERTAATPAGAEP